jgi:hypothetical protein
MQPVLVHLLRLRSYDHLFVTNMANSPCGPNIDHQLKRFAHCVILCYPLQWKHPVFATCYLGNELFVVTEASPFMVKVSCTDKMLKR